MEHLKHFIDVHKERVTNGIYPDYYPEIELGADEFEFLVYRKKNDPLGNDVKAEKIIGDRTTYWAPNVQI